MPLEPLIYATGAQRSPPPWRRALRKLLRSVLLAIIVAVPVVVAYVSYRYPWIWYGSRDAYQRHRMLTFTLPPDHAVYEEDPGRAGRLLALPPDPRAAYVGDPNRFYGGRDGDYDISGDQPCAKYSPPFYRSLFGMSSPSPLIVIHERVGTSGHHRLVLATFGLVYPQDENFSMRTVASGRHRTAIWIRARSDPSNETFRVRNGNGRSIYVPLPPNEIMRIYAGQPDPTDDAHFTIKYEIDNIPGTIDGRLEADDTVTLKILDGPAATRPRSKPSTRP